MVIVVPPFAQGKQSDPPEIGGVIPGLMSPVTPQVRRAVNQPGGMIQQCRADKNPPDNPGQSYAPPSFAQGEESAGQRQGQENVAALQEAVHRVLDQVKDVTLVAGGIV